MTDRPDLRLLLVHAHPDDESIGQGATMARYVAEGAGVTLVTCTAGEMGEILVPELVHLAADQEDKLGEHRKGEIADAMKVLGVTDHRWLGGFRTYRDSGMKWHEDGNAIAADEDARQRFWHADLTEAADHLVRVIREVQPQVLVTYDQFGGYGHPDHIQAHRVAMYAAQLAAVPSYCRELGEPWDIAKIYWGAMSETRMRESLRAICARPATPPPSRGWTPTGRCRRSSPPTTTSRPASTARPTSSRRWTRCAAYPTQITLDGPFFALSNNEGNEMWGEEFFRIAKGERGELGADGLESDLFAGIEP